MALPEEKKRILKMLESGTITAEEAAKLLEALESTDAEGKKAVAKKPRWLHVRVYERGSESPAVNVNVPLALMGIVRKIGGRFLPGDAMESLEQLLDEIAANPELGKIVEVSDREDGDRVEIVVE